MRIVVCWAGMQGYIASCLQALRRVEGIDLHVIYLDFQDLPLHEDLLAGIPSTRLLATNPHPRLPMLVEAQRPDIVFLCGWFYQPYRQLVRRPALRSARFVLGMDTPWTGSWRQRLNQIRLRGFMRRMDRIIVAGSRSEELARRLGTPLWKIRSGFYGFDFKTFAAQGECTLDVTPQWPHRFLFAGRYVPAKGLGVLIEAYRAYHDAVENPWPLDVCGAGPEAWRFSRVSGVHDLGYVQPSGLPKVFAAHGAFVMPSLEEPWGVAVAEAAATGLPLVCSDACGAAEDLLRPPHNGILVPAGDATALAAAMTWLHQHPERLRSMGAESRRLAQDYSADVWAERMIDHFRELLAQPATRSARAS